MTLPLSTAASIGFGYLAVLGSFFLIMGNLASSRTVICNLTQGEKLLLVGVILLYIFLLLTISWTVANPDEYAHAASKYRKLLFIPFLVIGAKITSLNIRSGFFIFSVVNFFVACFSLSIFFGAPVGEWLTIPGVFHPGDAHSPTFGRNHITQGFFHVVSAYFLVDEALNGASRKEVTVRSTALWLMALVIVSVVLFALGGRTGYVLFFVAILVAVAVARRSYRPTRGFLIGVVGAILWGVSVFLSPVGVNRFEVAHSDVMNYFSGSSEGVRLTSQGTRLTYYEAGLKAFGAAPLLGQGLGSFAELARETPFVPLYLKQGRPQPHSEVILMLVQGGLVGLMLYLFTFIASIRLLVMSRGNGISSSFLLATLAMYGVGSTFNSFLWDAGEGHFFTLLVLGIFFRANWHRNQ